MTKPMLFAMGVFLVLTSVASAQEAAPMPVEYPEPLTVQQALDDTIVIMDSMSRIANALTELLSLSRVVEDESGKVKTVVPETVEAGPAQNVATHMNPAYGRVPNACIAQ